MFHLRPNLHITFLFLKATNLLNKQIHFITIGKIPHSIKHLGLCISTIKATLKCHKNLWLIYSTLEGLNSAFTILILLIFSKEGVPESCFPFQHHSKQDMRFYGLF